MLQHFRRRNLSGLHQWIAADNRRNPEEEKHIPKRSVFPTRNASSRRRNRFPTMVIIASIIVLFSFSFTRKGKAFVLVCRIVTSFLEARCDSEDVALWRGTHLEEHLAKPPDPAAVTIDLVVSHCDLPIGWVFDWAGPYGFRSISIFSKCGNPVVGAPENARIVRLENVGRCDHTYARFMADYRRTMVSETATGGGNVFVLFLKDNDNSHRNHYSRHKKLEEMIPLAAEYGFSCHEETNWVWSDDDESSVLHNPICRISYYHDWESLRKFELSDYSRLRRDGNLRFRSQNGENLGEYADQAGIQPREFSSGRRIAANATTDIGRQGVIVPVCYGGNFLVRGEQIRNVNPGLLERIEKSLNRSDNIAEGHFVERLWGTILAKPLHPDTARRILGQAREGACRVEKNHLGALSK